MTLTIKTLDKCIALNRKKIPFLMTTFWNGAIIYLSKQDISRTVSNIEKNLRGNIYLKASFTSIHFSTIVNLFSNSDCIQLLKTMHICRILRPHFELFKLTIVEKHFIKGELFLRYIFLYISLFLLNSKVRHPFEWLGSLLNHLNFFVEKNIKIWV